MADITGKLDQISSALSDLQDSLSNQETGETEPKEETEETEPKEETEKEEEDLKAAEELFD